MIVRIVVASILIPVVLALLFLAPVWAFLLALEFFLLVSVWEMSRMLPAQSARGYALLYPLSALAPWIWCYGEAWFGAYLLGAGLALLTWSVVGGGEVREGFSSSAANLFAFLYLAVPFSFVGGFHPALAVSGYDSTKGLELAWIFAVIWISDSGAYFVGRAFGKHKVSPRISPNKSLEGFVAAVLFGGGGGALLGGLLFSRPWLHLVLAAVLLSLAAIFGDLFESLLKRSSGVKDTSNLIPGHGGVLDRVDSLLFAVLVYHLLSQVAKMFPSS